MTANVNYFDPDKYPKKTEKEDTDKYIVKNLPECPAPLSTDKEYRLCVASTGIVSWSAYVAPDIPVIPDAPSTAGSYKLVVSAEGVATWTAIT